MWNMSFGAMHGNGYFKREEFPLKELSRLENFKTFFKNTDIYIGCYYYTFLSSGVKMLYGNFYLDFDGDLENDFNNIKEDVLRVCNAIKKDFGLQDKHIKLFFSGSKGFHVLVHPHNLGFGPMPKLNECYKDLAFYYKRNSQYIDTKIYDDRRVFRVVNSINRKTGLYKIYIPLEELPLLSYQIIIDYAKNEHPVPQWAYINKTHRLQNIKYKNTILDKISKEKAIEIKTQKRIFNRELLDKNCIFPCIDRMLNEIHEEGNRNKKLIIIASHFLQKEIPVEEVQDFLYGWNQTHNLPPLKDREVQITIESASNQLQAGRRYGCRSMLEMGYCDMICDYVHREKGKNDSP